MLISILSSFWSLLQNTAIFIFDRLCPINKSFNTAILRHSNGIILATTLCILLYSTWLLGYFVRMTTAPKGSPAGKTLPRHLTCLTAALILLQDLLCTTVLLLYRDPHAFLFYNISSLVMCWISQGAVYLSVLIAMVFHSINSPNIPSQRRRILNFFYLVAVSLSWTILVALSTSVLPSTAILGMLHTCGSALKMLCLVAGYYAIAAQQSSADSVILTGEGKLSQVYLDLSHFS